MKQRKIATTAGICLLAACAVETVPVHAAPAEPALAAAAPEANTIKVKGVIIDETGEPLLGANVRYSKDKGTVTDINGQFELDVPKDAALIISYIGYADQKIYVAGRSVIDIVMQPDNKLLDETVVIGYGVQKKSNVTGAISSVKAEDLLNNVNTNAAQSLQGKVAGVQVVNASGAPGSAPSIRVRGYSSNGSSDPLYIVDGLKVSDISYLDPSSIQSMEILKDAASAAIYGAEAGNGVVLITTNSGKKGTSKITFDASWSFQKLANKVDVMNASTYKNFMTEAYGEAFGMLYDSFYSAGMKNSDTDWQDTMFETGTMQKYNVGLQGGNDNGTFYVNLGSMKNEGMLVENKDYYKRLTGQINASYKIRKWLDVNTSNTIAYIRNNGVTEGNIEYGFMKGILLADPLTPVYYNSLSDAPEIYREAVANKMPVIKNGDQYLALSRFTHNPMQDIYASPADPKTNGDTSFFLNGQTSLNFNLFKGFVFTSRLGYSLSNSVHKNYDPAMWNKLTGSASAVSQDPTIDSSQRTTHYYQWENFANYNIKSDIGNWGVMAGMSYSDRSTDYIFARSNELTNYADNFHYLDYSTTGADDKISGNMNQQRQIAYFGRLSWDWAGRYNAQFNFRADSYDAAYLDLDHNWGFFPSASIGWIFSEEDFMQGTREKGILTFGKFRASYGVNGSISNLGNYMYSSTVKTGSLNSFMGMNLAPIAYVMNGQIYQGTYPSTTLANPKLRWERSKQIDLGLDLRWFNDRLTTTLDYYNKVTDGLLIRSQSLLTTGTTNVYQNLGKVTNQGFEAEVEWRDHIGDFNYGIKANIATISNEVTEYKGEGTRIGGKGMMGAGTETYFEEGYPIWYLRGYKMTGVDPQTGAAIYQDTNKDGQITDDDRVDLGSAIPTMTYGITLNFGYKGLDLSIYGAGSYGNKLAYALLSANSEYDNRPSFLTDGRWQKAGDNASMPSAIQQISDKNFYNSDALVRDASFFKIKQIQLGYSLPKILLKKVAVESLRLYCSLDNFFTFTSYEGSDPECSALSDYNGFSASAMALDYGSYPSAKTVSFGFNVAF